MHGALGAVSKQGMFGLKLVSPAAKKMLAVEPEPPLLDCVRLKVGSLLQSCMAAAGTMLDTMPPLDMLPAASQSLSER